jgi:hypothetical protein
MSLVLDRLITRTRLSWYGFTAAVSFLLIFLAISTAYLDGILDEFFSESHWRYALIYPALITYMLSIIPPLQQAGDSAMTALRPLVPLDDDSFKRLLVEASGITPKGELIALGAGMTLGVLGSASWMAEGGFSWRGLYMILVNVISLGLLSWEIYIAFAGTKPIAAIYRHLSNVDVFNVRPFEPIGRYSLAGALAFVGGAAINAFFSSGEQEILSTASLITHGTLILISVLVFFLSMRGTHGVLAEAKAEELQAVQLHIADAYRSLESIPAGSPDINALSTKLNLWQAYEKRLKAARTWPYNFGMLRTLFLSVLTPIVINLVQRLIAQLLS